MSVTLFNRIPNYLMLVVLLAMFLAELLAGCATVESPPVTVTPSGDAALDRENLHAALADAAPGDTILLGAGVFNLTPPEKDPADCSLDVAIPLPGGDSLRFWDTFVVPPDPCYKGSDWFPIWGERNAWELFLIDKPLTIRGAAGPAGPLTILRVDERFSEKFLPHYAESGKPVAAIIAALPKADSYTFLVGAPDVTIEHIEFDGPTTPVMTFWAGTNIRHCVFRAIGFGPYFYPDERSIYPDYPVSFSNPKPSWFQKNVFIDAAQGIHLVGSEVNVTGNVFDVYRIAVALMGAAVATVPADRGGFGFTLVRAVTQNNLIADNVMKTGAPRNTQIWVNSWPGGPVRNNRVVNNRISGDGNGILFIEQNPYAIENTTITNNSIFDNDVRVSGQYGIALFGGSGARVESNSIDGARVGIWIEWTISPATLNPTAPTLFVVPATGNLVRDNVITHTEIGVQLGPLARDNTVVNNKVTGSAKADYQLNGVEPAGEKLGPALTFGPASGNTLGIAAGSVVLDQSGCTNTATCDQHDDDGDGLFGEDPGDRLNNDTDKVDTEFGVLSLVDEDPTELPNVIEER